MHRIVPSWLSNMFAMDQTKTQPDTILTPADAPQGAIISPDTRRETRIPPGQSRTKKWPILDANGTPPIDLGRWTLSVGGLVAKPFQVSWSEFLQMPRVQVFADFHCVTRWSRLGNVWEGVSTRDLAGQAGGVAPEARFVLHQRATTTVGRPTSRWTISWLKTRWWRSRTTASRWRPEHGGPARLIVPQLVRLEEREVDGADSNFWTRPCWFLGTQRIPHAWRSMEGRTVWLVSSATRHEVANGVGGLGPVN